MADTVNAVRQEMSENHGAKDEDIQIMIEDEAGEVEFVRLQNAIANKKT
ncbi:MAG: hypothetical protein ACRERU_09540 [Methylococcales bacterium]